MRMVFPAPEAGVGEVMAKSMKSMDWIIGDENIVLLGLINLTIHNTVWKETIPALTSTYIIYTQIR